MTGRAMQEGDCLSRRELEVLDLVAEGLTNRQIGGRLYLSLSTVKAHVQHILIKTGAPNRARAAVLFRSGAV